EHDEPSLSVIEEPQRSNVVTAQSTKEKESDEVASISLRLMDNEIRNTADNSLAKLKPVEQSTPRIYSPDRVVIQPRSSSPSSPPSTEDTQKLTLKPAEVMHLRVH